MTIADTMQAALNHLGTCIPELAVQLRYVGDNAALAGSITTAISAGIDRTRDITEEGISDVISGTIRYSSVLEPAGWGIPTDGAVPAINGQVVEIRFPDSTTWRRLRVVNRKAFAGFVRLNVAAEFEES
jgi:hypothetical protein